VALALTLAVSAWLIAFRRTRPEVVLWLWERPESVGFADPDRIGFAVMAGTITIEGASFSWRPRLQPVELPPAARTVAVVRIETNPSAPVALDADTEAALAELLAATGHSGLQIDFDARLSERAFYRRLLEQVRARLPHAAGLSITALASWCAGDNWIAGLPVDEAVPMFFRMGGEALTPGALREPLCAGSAGISLDEPGVHAPGRRLYVFNPRPWSRAEVEALLP